MTWAVETLNAKVDREIATLPADLQASLIRTVDLIEEHGFPFVGQPHVKHLTERLWEIRAKGRSGVARAIYVTATGETVVILHVFQKKTQKTPIKNLKLAKQRLRDMCL
ncbi:MAG: type II toxin-antitoxin system RelE/ParE family toxin [Alphaproteobacteria bacterium]|nr:type II toxin-antitoxin system RelE/ParE family toxin [Alphaproteobacteria bacterium]